MTQPGTVRGDEAGDKAVSAWLFLLCFMVFGMVAGGGHARTIGAGFAIQVWQPVTGFIPPRGPAQWQHLYALFQQTAQYQAGHPAITLAQFKQLFWPMFYDRAWGRLMAVVFIVPLAWFWWRGRVSNRLALWLVAIFATGGAEAAFGWLMVRTGLTPGTVTPPAAYVAPHFLVAMAIFCALLWTALSIRRPVAEETHAPVLRPLLDVSIGLILLTMFLGALVAGNNAVSVYNTFPTMDGQWVPSGYAALHPAWLNFLANKATVQFNHRLAATATAAITVVTAVAGLRATLPPAVRDAFLCLAGLIVLQYLLGMATIVLGSGELGYVHELNAVLLLTAAVTVRHGLRRTATPPIFLQPAQLPAE